MAVVCSRCSKVYESVDACPRCGAPVPVIRSGDAPGHGPRWQQTTWGRILIGLILAQGVFYALRHLFTGVLLAIHEAGEIDLWSDPRNVFLLHSVLGFAVFVGGIFAGGGQHYGWLVGALTGVWNGVMAALLRQHPAGEIASLGFFSQPLLQSVIGAMGGIIGSSIWRPISSSASGIAPSVKKAVPKKISWLAGPIAWVRVLIGSAGVVAGSLFAGKVFQKILDLSGDGLGTTNDFQDHLITWQIKALLVVLGAAFAGATTKNGLKQGLVVGILASSILIGIQAPLTQNLILMIGYTIVGTLSLCLAGGWFGGQLLPPILRVDRRVGGNGAPAW